MNIHYAIAKGPDKNELQDALNIIKRKSFNLFVVADGLGSAKNSAFGAKIAIESVKKAVFEWRKLENRNERVLIQLIHFYWNLLIGDSDFEKKDCSTTCLFTYMDKKTGEIILGQLGDGLLLFKSKKETLFIRSGDDYNYTKSLGSSKSYNDWNIKRLNNKLNDFTLLITTDGISEDLIENEEDKFAEKLIEDLVKEKLNKRNNHLNQLLKNWPTKFHTDDKTICLAWEKKKQL
ncbi:protein phosphatase 2C domain-containing protein [Tenacibaculum dicentrarchi]|nr:protein phosphatase 2C domain-containing protein [Tenacibaculum dicentrarchi]